MTLLVSLGRKNKTVLKAGDVKFILNFYNFNSRLRFPNNILPNSLKSDPNNWDTLIFAFLHTINVINLCSIASDKQVPNFMVLFW